MRIMGRGSRGEDVRDVQARLSALGHHLDPEEHGEFGATTERAVRAFQQRRRLLVDGLVGEDTWEQLVEAGYAPGDRILYFRLPSFRGDDVRGLQSRLNMLGFDAGKEDGIFGERTDRAVREFQRNVALPDDGIVGATTLQALGRLRPVGPGPGRATVREGEVLRRLAASLDGATVAIDPAHGPDDPGGVGPTGLTEGQASYLLAEALHDELANRGASPFLSRRPDSTPAAGDRARAANEAGAEILVSIHLNTHEDGGAEGASCYYFGREGWSSQAGQRLAELIQGSLVDRLGLKDGRTHPLSLALLRETRMPAVHVEPCFITNPREEALLRDEQFRGRVATAMAEAIEAFFRSPVADAPAGDSAANATSRRR